MQTRQKHENKVILKMYKPCTKIEKAMLLFEYEIPMGFTRKVIVALIFHCFSQFAVKN